MSNRSAAFPVTTLPSSYSYLFDKPIMCFQSRGFLVSLTQKSPTQRHLISCRQLAQSGLRIGPQIWALCSLLLLSVLLVSTGCTIGPVGTIAGRVSLVEGGWVMETYTLGAHLRTTGADDPGFGLGAAKRTYLFAEGEAPAPRAGWYLVILPRVALGRAVLRHIFTSGIDLHLGPLEAGIVVGMQRVTATRPESADCDTFRDLRFEPSSPTSACVSTQRERPC